MIVGLIGQKFGQIPLNVELRMDLSIILCQGEIQRGNRPSNSMAKRFKAAFQSWIGIVHFLEML